MRLFELDWNSLLKYCESWEELPEESKLHFLFTISPPPDLTHESKQYGVQGGLFEDQTLDPPLDSIHKSNNYETKPLIDLGFLRHSFTNKKIEFPETSKLFHSFLKDLLLCDMFDNIEDTTNNLIEYLSFFYTESELMALTSNFLATRRGYEEIGAAVTSAYRLKQFLEASNSEDLTVEYSSRNQLPLLNVSTKDKHFKIAKNILRGLIEGSTATPLSEITEIAGTNNTKLIGKAISLLLENILVFVSFSEYVNSPVIGIHPLVHHFINPGEMPLVKSRAQVKQCPAFLVDDMTILLTEASLAPIPLRQSDHKPYAKSIKAITSKFYQLPEECNHLFRYTDEERLRMAMLALDRNELVSIQTRKKEKTICLYAEEEGRYWLKLSDRDRLEEILTMEQEYHKRFYDLNRSNFPLDSTCFKNIEHIRDEFSNPYNTPNLTGSLYGALKMLADVNQPVTETSFFERQVFLENPLFTLLQCGLPYMNQEDWHFQNIIEKQQMINFWLRSFQKFIIWKAIPLGLLKIGLIPEERDYAISLSDEGLFFTENLKRLPAIKQSDSSILIQPNFDIVFMSQNPRAEVKLGQFCERLNSGIGTLFKITRTSIQKGASIGLTVEYVLGVMTELSNKTVPPNVTEQVKNWISQCKKIAISTKVLFTCPDIETALQIKSSGKDKVEQITDTIIAVSDKKYAKSLEKKLKKMGIFRERG